MPFRCQSSFGPHNACCRTAGLSLRVMRCSLAGISRSDSCEKCQKSDSKIWGMEPMLYARQLSAGPRFLSVLSQFNQGSLSIQDDVVLLFAPLTSH